ncbi:hypothetical protein EDD86DRAFT_249807 [Gorgonomyces haynaldii]|nr:hypothetical protein EDD86DRAFT_249807 [Gorgonomyces haynaldii]
MGVDNFLLRELEADSNHYYEKKHIREMMQSIMTGITYEKPEDPLAYIEKCIQKIRSEPQLETGVRWNAFLPALPSNYVAKKPEGIVRRELNEYTALPRITHTQRTEPEKKPTIVQHPLLPPIVEIKTKPAWNNIVFVLGGPGSGKGTQCVRIAKELNYSHLSVGDLLREEVARGSDMGKQMDALMKEGKIEITLQLLKNAMDKESKDGFLVDGFPRKLDQAIEFEKTLGKCKTVLYYECSEAETIKKRFRTFVEASYPVVEYFMKQGRCTKISAEREVDQVYADTRRALLGTKQGHPNIVFVLGGPGSGKGTQCARISVDFNLKHLSTGDLLRAEVEKKSAIGLEAAELMKEGKMVPLDMILNMLKAEIERNKDAHGFLIDGFPRTMDQAIAFEKSVGECRSVIAYSCPLEILEQRLLERGKTSGRADDNLDTIRKRFQAYQQQSMPVIEYYKKQGKCTEIVSDKTIDQVYEQTSNMLKATQPKRLPFDGQNIVFVLGGPGSGKGTQCVRIAKELNYSHLSVGDLLREEVARGSDMGKQMDALMKEGKIEITLQLLKNAMDKESKDGFLVDGFPRKLDQAIEFEKTLGKCKTVLYYECSEAETIKKRFRTFVEASYPVVEYFMKQGRCTKISAEREVDQVYADTRRALLGTKQGHPNIVFVLGGPGSGKGTQCARISVDFNLKHLSTGDLLRAEVEKKSAIGLEAAELMKEGKMVPLDMILNMLKAEIERNKDAHGFLIDGFPRTMDQAIAFEKSVGECRSVIAYSCPLEILEQRLLERGKTSGRADDNLDTIRKRFQAYQQQSMPVIEYYKKQGKCTEIVSDKTIDQVYEQTSNMLKATQPKRLPFDGQNIVFVLGGPGSGKGTQCEQIIKNFGYAHLSTGDLLRDEVKRGTALGQQLEADMKEGKMEVTMDLLKTAMESKQGAPGYLIDGFPRTMEQAQLFENTLGRCTFVLYFEASNDVLTARLLKRGETSGRADDNLESIKKRLKTFEEASMPVIEYYQKSGRTKKVNSERNVDLVTTDTLELFKNLKDFTKTEILSILKRSAEMKALVRNNPHPNTKPFPDMRGKTLGIHTRTRVSAESGWAHFGGQPLFLSKNDIQLGSGEPIKDTSIVISSMVDLIFARLGDHSEIEELAKHSSVPVINALTAKYHPMQILADLLTLYETYDPKFGNLNLKVAWVGDANNIVNSMIVTFPRMGIQMAVATPKKYELDPDIQQIAHASGTLLTHDPQEAVKDADVIITDTWVSMGQEAEFEQRMRDFKGLEVYALFAKKTL